MNGGGQNAGANAQFSCVCLHSDKKPQERNSNLELFKSGNVRFMICTDVAARGIDIKVFSKRFFACEMTHFSVKLLM